MVTYKELEQRVEGVRQALTVSSLEGAVGALMRQGEDIGGGVNALRLVKRLLDDPEMPDTEAVWAYARLKPAFRATFEEIPSLVYFEGD